MEYKFIINDNEALFDINRLILNVNNEILKLNSNQKKMQKKIYYKLSDSCNNRCQYCFQNKDKSRDEKIDFEGFRDLLTDLNAESDVLHFLFGGEPFLKENLINLRILLEATQCKFFVFTNGCWDSDVIKFIRENSNRFETIIMTIDGPENVHNLRRPYKYGNGYNMIIKSIKECSELGLQLLIQVNVDNQNIEDISTLLKDLIFEFKDNVPSISLNRVLHSKNTMSELMFLDQSLSILTEFPEIDILVNSKTLKNISSILFDEGVCDYRCECGLTQVFDFQTKSIYSCPQSIQTVIGKFDKNHLELNSENIKKYNE